MKPNRSENICNMIKGNKETIKNCLYSESQYTRMDAILWATYHKYKDYDIIERIIDLKIDNEGGMGYSVGNYAIAALDILNIEKYSGDENSQKDLISNFLPTKEAAENAFKINSGETAQK